MIKKNNYALGLAWLVAVFILPFPFIATFATGLPAVYANMKPSIANGIVAYVWLLLAIYIGTKPKWLDRLIGLPAVYMIHGILSLVAIVLAFMHKSMLPSAGLVKNTGDWAFALLLGLAIYSMVFMAGWLTSRVPLLAKIKRSLEKFFKHEISVWLHRLNLLAVFLIFVHVQLIDFIASITSFMILFNLATAFVFASYLWAKFKPAAKGYAAKLVTSRLLADNITELVIHIPKNKVKNLKAGDYVFISFPQVKGLKEPHPFSIVNAPTSSGELILAIRGDGDFTRALQGVQAPSRVVVDGGYGMFQTIVDDQQPRQLLMISGGIGITPLLSIIDANPEITTQVFHGATTEAALIYGDKFAQWSEERDNFQVHREVGQIEEGLILSSLPDDVADLTVLISGPPAMARYWMKTLAKNGVPKGQIFYEEFGW
ncbi:FAD-binding oxidoreductase [Streptococcus plurextorum]|uniref:FAD-binding oxidoreductase n=1 Tax=Streptococcus plurextorum TaxID=456876 RepID=UPI0004138455|nr:FAD-binding oxidoreductase [Streptococcus plurextorum]